jgi:Animal haem peroxidase
MATSRHGSAVRGLDSVSRSSIRDVRFGRLFRNLAAAPFTEGALLDLAATMFQGEFADRIAKGEPVDVALDKTEEEDENPNIPAGYTYLGQFIDHDITFDPVSSLDRFNDPEALQDFRTPRLDLDSVYGSGPDDQPFLYASDGAHLLLGDDKDFDDKRKNRPDLPRNTAKPRRALIGDKRNDENVIVSQLHTLFLRFHNAVLDSASGGKVKPGDFEKTQRIVRWHYQWIVLHDFLKRVVGDETYQGVIKGPGETPVIRFYKVKGRYAFMPIEFSVAAYRFGHSMVRPSYALNRIVTSARPPKQPFNGKTAEFHRIPIFSLVDTAREPLANLNGFREVPGSWAVDWAFFFDGVKPDGAPPKGSVLPQPSYKLDTILVDPLTSLPDHQDQPKPRRALAALNLLRGWRLGLPAGQAVAHRLGLEPLTDKQIFDHEDKERKTRRAAVLAKHPGIFEDNAPLWFYILREAESQEESANLGPIGGTIVAEVLAGLILEDRHSFLSQWPKWRPTLPSKVRGHFTMADLVNFTNQNS